MGRAEGLLQRMRQTAHGWRQGDFEAVLEYYGYEFVRNVNHGAMFRHPVLARHPDIAVRRNLAQVVIPRGDELREYVRDDVVASIDALLTYEGEENNG